VARLVSSNDDVFELPSVSEDLWARDSYWQFCNFYWFGYWFSGGVCRLGKPPYAFIARYLRQLFTTVRFLHHSIPAGSEEEPISHWNLEWSNLFLDWGTDDLVPNAYIGDLSWANDGDLIEGRRDTALDNCDMLSAHLDCLVELTPEARSNSERHEMFTEIIQKYMDKMNP
jgi:hypothetical protein